MTDYHTIGENNDGFILNDDNERNANRNDDTGIINGDVHSVIAKTNARDVFIRTSNDGECGVTGIDYDYHDGCIIINDDTGNMNSMISFNGNVSIINNNVYVNGARVKGNGSESNEPIIINVLSDVNIAFDVDTESGDVILMKDVHGLFTVKTMSGDVSMHGVHLTGDSCFHSMSGDVKLDVIADENVNVSIDTMSGDINMESVNHVNVCSHDTISGSYMNGNNGSGRVINLTASTMSGNIHVK